MTTESKFSLYSTEKEDKVFPEGWEHIIVGRTNNWMLTSCALTEEVQKELKLTFEGNYLSYNDCKRIISKRESA